MAVYQTVAAHARRAPTSRDVSDCHSVSRIVSRADMRSMLSALLLLVMSLPLGGAEHYEEPPSPPPPSPPWRPPSPPSPPPSPLPPNGYEWRCPMDGEPHAVPDCTHSLLGSAVQVSDASDGSYLQLTPGQYTRGHIALPQARAPSSTRL